MQKNENRPGYKKTKVGWIPLEWETNRVENIASRVSVGIASAATHAYRDEGIRMYRNLNVAEGYLDDRRMLFIDPDYEYQHRRKRLKSGDIVTVRTGYPGLSAVVKSSQAGSQVFTSLITSPNPEIVFSHFLCTYINSPHGKIQFGQMEIGGAQKNVNAGALAKMFVPLPSLPEQEAIAGVLECWDRGIRKLELKIGNKRRIKKGLMQQLLSGQQRLPGFFKGWKTVRLEQIGEFYKGAGIAKSELSETGVPCIRYGEIYTNDDFVIKTFRSFISKELAAQSQRINQNDLLFAGSGETAEEIGKSIAYMKTEEAYAGGDIVIVAADIKCARADYLSAYFNTAGRRQLNRLGQGQSVVHIYPKNLKKVELPLPPLEEQQAIAKVLRAADREIETLERKLDKWRDQKKYLLNNLVTGSIRLPEFIKG
ncbi:Type-1 restriction enzyme EcoKI specificity protein [Pontiella desulfatans]|uniref:Type-1 restriction enzyme EcoKI specificity protein n=1 Tax=Pontiella desulfatans TaxID=2750659 RepID=A0A6C2U0N4_PONDE|nr:restriction endonuclease subunit S [Pontiella desulfatans]VGO13379.1 Type-1 restriction enzyme EcoKI specificity protein [Pontiella desulfatans]